MKTKKEAKAKIIKMAKKEDWDRLASEIILIEYAIREKRNAKSLKILQLKLEIYEKEKASRIVSTFNMKNFLNKSFEEDVSDDFY